MPAARKGEKITDPVVLERLAKAREKALETRRANAKMKADAKLADELERKKADAEVQKRIKKTIDPEPPKEEPPKEAAPIPKPKEEEPEQEVQIEYIKAPKKKPKKKKVVIVESETESEEEEVVYKKKSKRVKNETPQKERPLTPPPIERDPMDVLFSRLYGK
jgi:hypothetical protein